MTALFYNTPLKIYKSPAWLVIVLPDAGLRVKSPYPVLLILSKEI